MNYSEDEPLLAVDPYAQPIKYNWEKWEDISKFLYNKETKEYCGRTLRQWVQLGIFTFWFNGFLLAFFVVAMALYICTIDEITPREQQPGIVLQNEPGLSYRPVPDFESPLIRFIQGREETYQPYVIHLESFLDQYEYYNQDHENFIDCKQYEGQPRKPDEQLQKVCKFEIRDLGDCQKQSTYGFEEGKPCILLKLNKVFGWVHEIYPDDEVPDEIADRFDPSYIGVSCEGENPADIENIGNITYHPPQGFPGYYYPFLNQEDFRSPLVFVRFNNPTNGMVINVRCYSWWHNIEHNINEMKGVVRFSLLID